VPALYILVVFLIMVDLAVYKPLYTWPGLFIVILGVPVFFIWRKKGKKVHGS
jgi:APA family basic amino acid/polyamine antiporter